MRKTLSLLALLCAPSWADPAVQQADAELNRLIQQGDASAAAPFYAADFVLTTGAGTPKDRARILGEIASPTLKLTRNHTEQVQVRVLGDTAVLTGVLHQAGEWQGKTFDQRVRVTDTWVRQQGRWVLLAGHASLIPS